MPVKTNLKPKSTKLTFGAVVLIIIVVIAIITTISFFVITEPASRTIPNFFILLGIVSAAVITAAVGLSAIRKDFNKSESQRDSKGLEPMTPVSLEELSKGFGEFGAKLNWIDRKISKVGDLRAYGKLVITGPMKIGKTREAYELIRRALAENLVTEDHLYELNPSCFKSVTDTKSPVFTFNYDPKSTLLIFVDDFPRLFPCESLKEVRKFLLSINDCKDVYVILTARKDQLEDLHVEWLKENNFKTLEMPKLGEKQTRSLVDNATGVFGLQMEKDAREVFVQKRDGTPELPLMAMRRLKRNPDTTVNVEKSIEVLEENITEQWQATRRDIEKNQPEARYIFDSLITFSKAKVSAFRYLIFQFTLHHWKQDKSIKYKNQKKKLEEVFSYLEHFAIESSDIIISYPDYVVESNYGSYADIEELGNFLLHHRRIMANWLMRRFYQNAHEHAWALWDFSRHNIFSEEENVKHITRFSKRICRTSRIPVLYYNLGVFFSRQNRKKEAVKMYYKAIKISPPVIGAYFELGRLLQDLGCKEKAEVMYWKAVDNDQKNIAEAFFYLGNLYFSQNRIEEARVMYCKSIENNPDDAAPYYNLGNLMLRQYRSVSVAEEMYRKAIDVDPLYTNAYYNLGVLLIGQNRFDEAEEQYRQVLQFKPDDSDAYYGLACLESLRRNAEEAFAYLQKAFDLGWDNREHTCSDPDFDNIRDDPRFEAIVGCSELP